MLIFSKAVVFFNISPDYVWKKEIFMYETFYNAFIMLQQLT